MKVRKDFVTNSSSSSFIMAFKNEDEWSSYDHFTERCDQFDYQSFYKLIKKLQKYKENMDKDKALELLYHCYSYDYRFELLDSLVKKEDYTTWQEYYSAQLELENSEEFKEKVKSNVNQNTEYLNKKKQIEDADLIVQGQIWDSNGGLLEWAIRNGFIEDNFGNNCVIVWNVG